MLKKIFAALLLACAPAGAFAADSGFYALVAAGRSDFNSLQSSLDNDLQAAGSGNLISTFDGAGTGGKLGAGFAFNENLSVEISYLDLGHASYTASYGAGNSATAKLKTRGINASLVGSVPLSSQLSVFAKVGYFDSHVIAEMNANGPAATATGTRSMDSWGPSFGGGIAYNFNATWTLRGEFERFSRLSYELNAGQGYANLMSLGLVYKFY
jgi:OmpA-OmpF porin, OOP family